MSDWLHFWQQCYIFNRHESRISPLIQVTISKKACRPELYCFFNIWNLLFLKIFLISGRHIVPSTRSANIAFIYNIFHFLCWDVLYIYSTYFFSRLLTTDILLLSEWKLNIGHLIWQSSKVWFMFQRSNWQHFLHLQAARVRFLTYLKTLGDIYLALNGTDRSQIICLCLALPPNKEQTCFCG